MGGMGGMGGRSASGRAAPRKDPPIESTLNMTLEELYSGTTKKMKISRNVGAGRGVQGAMSLGRPGSGRAHQHQRHSAVRECQACVLHAAARRAGIHGSVLAVALDHTGFSIMPLLRHCVSMIIWMCLTQGAVMSAPVSMQLPAADLMSQVQGQSVSEILEIDVKPGWKQGTKITFPQKGERCSSWCCFAGVHWLNSCSRV